MVGNNDKKRDESAARPKFPFHVITWRTYIFTMIHLAQVRLLSPVLYDVINIRAETDGTEFNISVSDTQQRNEPRMEHQVVSPLLV